MPYNHAIPYNQAIPYDQAIVLRFPAAGGAQVNSVIRSGRAGRVPGLELYDYGSGRAAACGDEVRDRALSLARWLSPSLSLSLSPSPSPSLSL